MSVDSWGNEMIEYKRSALQAYRVLEPCKDEVHVASWLRDKLADHGVSVSRQTVYNWTHGKVTVPHRAWLALEQIENDARRHLIGQLEGLGK